MSRQPLNLMGVAEKLQVRYFRVRRWRKNALNNNTDPQARRLCPPDISEEPPLWSEHNVESWGRSQGLWPPGVDQHQCPFCKGMFSTYGPSNPVLRPHGWQENPEDGRLWPCEGSYQEPLPRDVAVLERSAA